MTIFFSKGLMVSIRARSTQSTLPPSWRGKLLSRCKLELFTMTRAILIFFLSPYLFSMTTIHRHYFLDVIMLGQNSCPGVMSLLTVTKVLSIIYCHLGTIRCHSLLLYLAKSKFYFQGKHEFQARHEAENDDGAQS